MDSPLVRRILAAVLVLLVVVLVLLLLWPEKKRERPSPRTERAAVADAGTEAVAGERGKAQLVHGPSIEELPDPTEKCVMLVEWHQQNVPPWVIEDNMDAQAMKFDEKDLACLTAGGLPPQILDRAEQNMLKPQPAPAR